MTLLLSLLTIRATADCVWATDIFNASVGVWTEPNESINSVEGYDLTAVGVGTMIIFAGGRYGLDL